ncbi:MAG: DUF4956 domain-containing protein [Oscillospiraceae bacterium]|nr:DUF4956 domain-containing protein [Oscillospiraceae bacterium]
MFDSIISAVSVDASFTVENLLAGLATALALGAVISFVYMKTHKNHAPSQSFAVALVVLPAIVTIIILLVGNNIARAFSLAGAFQIIRFRSAPGDPKDITYVLFSMAVGLCCGMGFLLYAVISAVILCLVMLILEFIHFGRPKPQRKLLKITIPESLDYSTVFDDIFEKHTDFYKRKLVKTKDMGSLFEVQYEVTEKPNMNEKAFIDDLRCRNGNLSITFVLDMPDNEF